MLLFTVGCYPFPSSKVALIWQAFTNPIPFTFVNCSIDAENRSTRLPLNVYEEDIVSLLHSKIHEISEVEIILLYQETHERPIVQKEVKPYGKGSHHAIVPAEIGKKFSSVILLSAEGKGQSERKDVIQGKIVILNEDDIYTLLEEKDLQIKDSDIHLIFQEEDENPVRKKEIRKFGERGYHVVVPAEIG